MTGASRGTGRAIARAFAEAGADVAVLARTTDDLRELALEVERLGRRAVVLTCDVTEEEQIHSAVTEAIGALGPLDIVANVAGGTPTAGPFLEIPVDAWQRDMRLNFDSVLHFCRAVGPHLLQRGTGSVINVSSVAGVAGVPSRSTIAVSKAAVIALTRTLGAEWASAGVRVNAILPGWTATAETAAVRGNHDVSAGLMHAVPMHRWGTPEQIADSAVYLAGDASELVTGSCLTIDGGVSAYVGGPTLLDLLALGRLG
ncbi:SDR family oxidoreductase [Streptomyces gilvosporeus]|uniref:SDR family oxidoreductase n=1 Tax=Streptomyces gilvosporeus TaxID=553510 RepID=A0A1V0TLI6_9ACTN|nr:SDR family oxidoreductase [Streptomyces gilvosporeus]